MGVWTFASFKEYLKLRMGQNDAFDSYYGELVNIAYKHLCSMDYIPTTKFKIVLPDLDKASTLTTTLGQTYITTPTDCLIVNELYDKTNNRRIDWFPYREYVRKTDTTTTTAYGQPTKWNRRGEAIFLYPTPAGAYSIGVDYRLFPSNMALTTDVTELPGEWDTIILELAVWVARNWAGEPEKAEYARKIAYESMAGLVTIYNNEEKARGEKFRPEPSSISRRT